MNQSNVYIKFTDNDKAYYIMATGEYTSEVSKAGKFDIIEADEGFRIKSLLSGNLLKFEDGYTITTGPAEEQNAYYIFKMAGENVTLAGYLLYLGDLKDAPAAHEPTSTKLGFSWADPMPEDRSWAIKPEFISVEYTKVTDGYSCTEAPEVSELDTIEDCETKCNDTESCMYYSFEGTKCSTFKTCSLEAKSGPALYKHALEAEPELPKPKEFDPSDTYKDMDLGEIIKEMYNHELKSSKYYITLSNSKGTVKYLDSAGKSTADPKEAAQYIVYEGVRTFRGFTDQYTSYIFQKNGTEKLLGHLDILEETKEFKTSLTTIDPFVKLIDSKTLNNLIFIKDDAGRVLLDDHYLRIHPGDDDMELAFSYHENDRDGTEAKIKLTKTQPEGPSFLDQLVAFFESLFD